MARRPLLDFEKPLVELEEQIEQIRQLAKDSEVDVSQQLLQLETLAARRREEIFTSLTPAQKIQVARHPQRPSTLDYIQVLTDEFIELHGDRRVALRGGAWSAGCGVRECADRGGWGGDCRGAFDSRIAAWGGGDRSDFGRLAW